MTEAIRLLMGHKVAGTTGLYLHVMFEKVDLILDQAFGDGLRARLGEAQAPQGRLSPPPAGRALLTTPSVAVGATAREHACRGDDTGRLGRLASG